MVGPAFEVRIIGPLSVTAEALYSRADYDHVSAGPFFEGPALDAEKHVVGRWEAPLLLKYSFKMRHLTPFLTAGASIQYDRDSDATEFFGELDIKTIPIGLPKYGFVSTRGPQVNSLVAGPTAGAGASFGAGRIRPSIEVRYTYWTDRAVAALPLLTVPFGSPTPVFPPTIASLHNQVQLLVGIMF
ncbi:MAG TPA: hypothetical protein VLM42_18825 [Bryobacteraceae bacterium]|nr:hypothetical protein [Bryobacteraceae bacterium]